MSNQLIKTMSDAKKNKVRTWLHCAKFFKNNTMKLTVILFSLSLAFFTRPVFPQQWSEPVVINPLLSNYYNTEPDFTIDNSGYIHCVWSTKHGTNFYRIYYSKSTDNGETWSNPVSVSYNSEKWAGEPHIVSDSENNLHLTYDYDVGSIGNIKILYKKFDGTNWSIPDTLNEGIYGCMHNRSAIDNNDRVYCFWYVPTVSSGNTYYRFLDFNEYEWSEIYNPYDSVRFNQILIDEQNTLHVLGSVRKLNYSWYKIGYFRGIDGIWDEIVEISPETHGNSYSMAIDQNIDPHIIWQQISPSSPGSDTMLYSHKDGNTWSVPEDLSEQADYLAICSDNNDDLHLALSNDADTNYILTYLSKIDGNWNNYFIDTGRFFHTKLTHFNSSLLMIQGIVDSLPLGTSPLTRILFRKMDIITSNNTTFEIINNLSIFPSPFSKQVYIKIPLNKEQSLNAQIYNLNKQKIITLYNGCEDKGNVNLFWDGKDENGNPVPVGIYLLNITTDNTSTTRKIIKH